MRPTFTRGVVAVTLVPLLVAEFQLLLRLVFAEFRAVAVHHALLLVVLAQTVPFGALVLPLGIFAPISGAPTGSVAIRPVVRLSGSVINGRRCVVARTIAAADSNGKTSLRKRRGAREKRKSDQ